MRKFFIILFFPFVLNAHIGQIFIPSNKNMNLNTFSVYNIKYKSVTLNYNHYYDNTGDMDLSFILPSEWNGTVGVNFYVYNYPSFPLFRTATPSTNIDYGFNFNYSNLLFGSNLGAEINFKAEKFWQEFTISPGLVYFLNNQYGNYSFIFISPHYKFYTKTISFYGGFYGMYNEKLKVQSVFEIPIYNWNDLMLDLAMEYRLPLNFVIGGDCEYKNGNLFSSAKAGISFNVFEIYGGVRYKKFTLNDYFIDLVIISRFGSIVKF
ncbi:hypothetical protein J7J58_07280 [candidate division WOR-3 bacterium]|nr:hypothetical protein [candidate division WOR-3 bacterium]